MSKHLEDPKINFWGIGTMKSGTSWLYYNLQRSPGFFFPPIKELHYFDRSKKYPTPDFLNESSLVKRFTHRTFLYNALRRVVVAFRRGEQKDIPFYLKWSFSNYNDDWYLSLFDGGSGLKGEITPSYSVLTKADIQKMYQISPNARLVLMLRNPVSRAWSHYRHTKKTIPNFDFSKVTNQDLIDFIESDAQTMRSDYLRAIDNYSSVFPKEQIMIGFFDAIIDNPQQLLQETIDFLGGPPNEEILKTNTKKIVNKSIEIKCPPEIKEYLKDKYKDQMLTLANRYGGYFNKWYEDTYGESSQNPQTELVPTLRLA